AVQGMVVVITFPTEGATLPFGVEQILTGHAEDNGVPVTGASLTWTNSIGDTIGIDQSCKWKPMKAGPVTITLTAVGGAGGGGGADTGTAKVDVTIYGSGGAGGGP